MTKRISMYLKSILLFVTPGKRNIMLNFKYFSSVLLGLKHLTRELMLNPSNTFSCMSCSKCRWSSCTL